MDRNQQLASCFISDSEQPDPVPVAAKTYYVAPHGARSNPGTEGEPWSSIEQASDVVRPGDSVVVKAGVYDAPYFGKDSIAGTARHPIVIKADPMAAPGTVIIAGKNSSADHNKGFVLQAGCDYVHIVGFTINNSGTETTAPGSITKSGIYVQGTKGTQLIGNTIDGVINGSGAIVLESVSDVLVEGNTMKNTTTQGRSTRGHGLNISAEFGNSRDIIVRNNIIRDNDYTGIQITSHGEHAVSDVNVSGNMISDNGQNGINADGLRNSRIENNLIRGYRDNSRNGITLYHIDSNSGSIDNVIVNNSIDQSKGLAIDIGHGDKNRNNIAFNNVLWERPTDSPRQCADHELLPFNNITARTPSPFIDANGGDYRLAPLGPGARTGFPSFRGVTAPVDRDGNNHIGAFSFAHKPPSTRDKRR